ncbi:MAG: hypothetical protein V4495_26380 [Pseudomonadota bacterium]
MFNEINRANALSYSNIYQISYDLIKFKDYPSLYRAIEGLGPNVRVLESLWLLKHPGTAIGIRDYLRSIVDNDDMLFVCKLEPDDGGSYNLPIHAQHWMIANADWVYA